MGIPEPNQRYTPEEYLRLERGAMEHHQYFQGEIFPIHSGPSVAACADRHDRILINLIRDLGRRLAGTRHVVFDGSARISIPNPKILMSPDVAVVRGPLQFDASHPNAEVLVYPMLIGEVLSTGSEIDDRGDKFGAYRSIESLREYVLVSQDAARVETFLRYTDGAWIYRSVSGLDARVRLQSLEITLPLSELFAEVTFPPPPPQPAPEEVRSPT